MHDFEHHSLPQQAGEPVADSARERVLTLWRALDPDGSVTADDRDRHFADLIGMSRWPGEPSGQQWAAVESSLQSRRRERGARP